MFKILIVDDDPDMLELLRVNFERAGFDVETAASGMEALHHARRLLPDLIVLDVLLPDLDGMSVCEILRRQPSTGDIPVIMHTAIGGQLSRLAGLESGADAYFAKPVSPLDLVDKVLELVRRKSPSASSFTDPAKN
jgi:DNA-binding response OmpR family regulator